MNKLPQTREYGVVFVYPWTYPDPWRWPTFTRTYCDGDGIVPAGKRVALSFGRAALVFDISWWRKWKR